MKKRKKKNYRRIKKVHFVGTLISLAIVIAIMYGVLAGFVQIVRSYIVESKLSEEYRDFSYLVSLYEQGVNPDDPYLIFDKKDYAYIVKDKDGKVIHKHGEITFDESEEPFQIFFNDMMTVKIHAYFDNENNHFRLREDYVIPDLSIDEYFTLMGDSINIGVENSGVPPEMVTNYDPEGIVTVYGNGLNEKMVSLPLWMTVETEDGSARFIFKAYMNVIVTEYVMFLGIITIVCILFAVVLIITLINAISSFINQNRTKKLFLTDMVTKDRSWISFIMRGEQILRKGSSKKKTFAVVNLQFVKYRNYCMCHSLAEGEKLLREVNKVVVSKLNKGELCAHATNSNFALLLSWDDKDKVKMRLLELIRELEKIDSNHNFSFQAGVDPINVRFNVKGKAIKREDIDLESEYNNAVTARISIGSDESGVAFFDDKLIADQKWIDAVEERQQAGVSREEFKVYYQPKYDPKTDELRGAEALIRWQSPELGFVPPGRFIPIFEENGFITEIDHYMISHVARDQKKWLDEGLKCVPVSVNVSRAHFVEKDLAEQIRDMVDKEGCPHEYVEIELTESAFFDDKKAIIDTINKLKAYGFSVSMDDFGSGYSSLNSLKDMPLDVLKLDAEFFRGDKTGNRGEIVVSEAIKLAKCLDMRIVAEGVEIRDQADFLANHDCDMIQGYIYSKPVTRDEYVEKMKVGKQEKLDQVN